MLLRWPSRSPSINCRFWRSYCCYRPWGNSLSSRGHPSQPAGPSWSLVIANARKRYSTEPTENNDASQESEEGQASARDDSVPEHALFSPKKAEHADTRTLHEIQSLAPLIRDNGGGPLVRVHGYIGIQRLATPGLTFARLADPHMRLAIQLVFDIPEDREKNKPNNSIDMSAPTSTSAESESTGTGGNDEISTQAPASQNLDQNGGPDTLQAKFRLSNGAAAPATGAVESTPDKISPSVHNKLRKSLTLAKYNSPVTLIGRVRFKPGKVNDARSSQANAFILDPVFGKVLLSSHLEIHVQQLEVHNVMPTSVVAQEQTRYEPEKRHLAIRTSSDLRSALRLRSRAMAEIRKEMFNAGFDEIETPLLFRSSPEGAREFIVPTRTEKKAYALPQSPQQYKQILMASGIAKYFQFARCFRDEDLRADRQPEFTQFDMEMAFATRRDILKVVEKVIRRLWYTMSTPIEDKEKSLKENPHCRPFQVYPFESAMQLYGTDKPDRRIGPKIHQADYITQDLVDKISTLPDPIVDIMRFPVSSDPKATRTFVMDFLESKAGEPFRPNPTGAPGIFVTDPSRPMSGLSAFGFEAAAQVERQIQPQSGDLIVISARVRDEFFTRATNSTTIMGGLRIALHKAALQAGFHQRPIKDDVLWVTKFPMFESTNDSEPGQGGAAGIKARHHPFTNFYSTYDPGETCQKLRRGETSPLKVWADSWDLVINGVEVGGGSVRIHKKEQQDFILRNVLQMPEHRILDFHPLLNALGAGCPPHAGMALGFDRLLAVLLKKDSIRDVMAFPKYGKGRDMMVGSPARLTEENLLPYGLSFESPAREVHT